MCFKIKIIIFVLMCFILTNTKVHAFEEREKYTDISLQIVAVGFMTADWLQTRYIATHPEFYERNPILGRHPSVQKVNLYFACTIIGNCVLAYMLPRRYRRWLQYTTIVFEGGLVYNNNKINIGMNTNF